MMKKCLSCQRCLVRSLDVSSQGRLIPTYIHRQWGKSVFYWYCLGGCLAPQYIGDRRCIFKHRKSLRQVCRVEEMKWVFWAEGSLGDRKDITLGYFLGWLDLISLWSKMTEKNWAIDYHLSMGRYECWTVSTQFIMPMLYNRNINCWYKLHWSSCCYKMDRKVEHLFPIRKTCDRIINQVFVVDWDNIWKRQPLELIFWTNCVNIMDSKCLDALCWVCPHWTVQSEGQVTGQGI